MPIAAANGADIHYETTGEGPPLLLVTGLGAGPAARAVFVDALARRHTVLSYDQRGTGQSKGGPAGLPIEGHADDIPAVLDAAGIAKAHVFGHSTGTGAATVLAADHPERVMSLTLAAPWTHADEHLRALQEMRKAAARTMPPEHYARFNALLLYPPEYRRAHAARFAKMAADAVRNLPNAEVLRRPPRRHPRLRRPPLLPAHRLPDAWCSPRPTTRSCRAGSPRKRQRRSRTRRSSPSTAAVT